MTELRASYDPILSIVLGLISGQGSNNKFGRATNCDSGVLTDVWDRANVADNQPTWLAPTAARVHAIVSTNDNDGKTGAPSSTGARTLRVWGLTGWGVAETYEDVTLDGTTSVNTTGSYVIIHRMKVLTFGASGPNVGKITATAATDATVTAQIEVGEGQTQMAIYGIPSTQTLVVPGFYGSIERDSPTGAGALYRLLWSEDVQNQPAVFTIKHTISTNVAAAPFYQPYLPYNRFTGPGILKLQVQADANDVFADGGFGIILVDN